jgi:hypothetical protein
MRLPKPGQSLIQKLDSASANMAPPRQIASWGTTVGAELHHTQTGKLVCFSMHLMMHKGEGVRLNCRPSKNKWTGG